MKSFWLALIIGVTTPCLADIDPCLGDEPRLRALVKMYSDRTGKEFVLDPRVNAKIGMFGLNAETMDYLTLVGIFNMHGYMAIESKNVVYVVPDRAAEHMRENLSRNESHDDLGANDQPGNFDLKVTVDMANNGVILECIEGCAWEYLSFSCEAGADCVSTVNGWGTPAE